MVQAVVTDLESAPVSDRDRELYRFVRKINGKRGQVRPEDVEPVKAAGWSDEAIFDAITVCSLFQFFNSWVDGNGVAKMDDEAYRASGRRLAGNGY